MSLGECSLTPQKTPGAALGVLRRALTLVSGFCCAQVCVGSCEVARYFKKL